MSSPASGQAKGKRRGHSKEYILTPDEVHRVEATARSPREKLYCRLMARWGLRAGEVAHVCPEWVSYQRGELRIPLMCRCATCVAHGSPWRPKNEASARTIPLHIHTETWEALRVFLTHYSTAGEAQVTRQGVWGLVKRLADRAGVQHRLFPHALRATAATQMADMGLSAEQLARALGWATARHTQPYIRLAAVGIEKAFEGKELRWW